MMLLIALVSAATYECTVCKHVYDPVTDATNDKTSAECSKPRGTAFEDLPDCWKCPVCGQPKSAYKPQLVDGTTLWVHEHEDPLPQFQSSAELEKEWWQGHDPSTDCTCAGGGGGEHCCSGATGIIGCCPGYMSCGEPGFCTGCPDYNHMGCWRNLLEFVVATADLSTLATAVKAGGLGDTLASTGPFTVFAPTNEAFAKLPKGTLDSLLKPENKAKLAALLEYHVVKGYHVAAPGAPAEWKDGEKIATLEGKELVVHVQSATSITINDSKVVTSNTTNPPDVVDNIADNGAVHLIDTVLMPPGDSALDAEQVLV